MNIVPSSTIFLLKNVPLNNTYDDTIQFASASDQIDYFGTPELHVATFTNQMYQRYDKGRLRISALADDLYQCNYMCFQNTGHGNNPKWFYAFVTSVDYINETVTEISYEIDVIQTYLFDISVGMCFVEREHPALDGIGDNIIEENVALGEFVYDDYMDIDSRFPSEEAARITDACVVLMSCKVYSGSVQADVYDNVVQGATLYAYDYDSQSIDDLRNFIASFARVPEELVAMYMVPKALIGTIPANHIISQGSTGMEHIFQFSGLSPNTAQNPTKFGSYTPKNNKLYTYPFTYLHVDNGSGDELRLRYEFFENMEPHLQIQGTLTPPVQLTARPASYKGIKHIAPDKEKAIYTQTITLDNFPMCSWSTDYYSTWIAQNLVPMGFNIISQALPAISMSSSIGSSSTAIAHGFQARNSKNAPYWKTIKTTNDVTSSSQNKNSSFSPTEKFSSAASIASEIYSAHIHSDDIRGNKFCANANFANHHHTFNVGRARITEQYAKSIDDYFTMFGYAIRRVKVPVIFNEAEKDRPHWNYLKTANCVLSKSNCPTDVANSIIDIFNNGITFWKHASEVGQYGRDNRPE